MVSFLEYTTLTFCLTSGVQSKEYLLPDNRRRIISHHYYNEAGEFDPHVHAGQPPSGLPEPGQPGYDEKVYDNFDFRENDYVPIPGAKKHFDYDERPGTETEIAPWFQKSPN